MGIGLPFDIPAAKGSVEIPKRPYGGRPSAGGFIGPFQLRLVFRTGRVEKRARLHHGYFQSCIGQDFGGHSSTSSGTYDNRVVNGRLFFDLHEILLISC